MENIRAEQVVADIPTAEEAVKITEKHMTEAELEMIDLIASKIKEAMLQGKYRATFDLNYSMQPYWDAIDEVMDFFERRGYRYCVNQRTPTSAIGDSTITIRWTRW